MSSPIGSKNSPTTPHLTRKNSGGSRSGRRKKSEDKISLMEAVLDDAEDAAVDTNLLTPSSADSRSRNSSLRNFDLLQVPGSCTLSRNNSSLDGSLSVVSFDMDNVSNADKSDTALICDNGLLGPLSLQIPEQHISPPEANRNCNGNIGHHPPLVRMNGVPLNHGEYTPLLAPPVREPINGGIRLATGKESNKQSLLGRAPSWISLSMEEGDERKEKNSNGSLYSKLDRE